MPARFSWLTGLRCSQIGVTRNGNYTLMGNSPSFARNLQNRGWHTAVIGKTHWCGHLKQQDLRDNLKTLRELGFDYADEIAGPRGLKNVRCRLTDEWEKAGLWQKQKDDLDSRYRSGKESDAWLVRPSILPNKLYPDIWVSSQAREYIKNLDTKKPWFLWISFVGPHEPFDTPYPWHGKHQPQNLPRPYKRKKWIRALNNEIELKKKAVKWTDKLKDEDIMQLRADYADHISLLDHEVGKIMDTLISNNKDINTAIAITSDHGDHLGDYGMLYKGSFMESSIRVPWIYIDPKKENRKRLVSDTPMELAETFKLMSENIYQNAGNAKKLKESVGRKNVAIIEFGNEIVIIKGNKKVCFNEEGDILWATKIKGNRDGCNINTAKPWRMKKGEWNRLSKMGKEYSRIIKREAWRRNIVITN